MAASRTRLSASSFGAALHLARCSPASPSSRCKSSNFHAMSVVTYGSSSGCHTQGGAWRVQAAPEVTDE